jgi:aryl-alcohol dehydrogenase-like predicted oxidoreductase
MGLGCMGMSGGYGPADDAESIATIHAALDVTLTSGDLARIARAVPIEAVAGTRYLPAVLAHMDSEHAG